MKTKEQIKSEVLNYLDKTSKHTFQNENGSIYKVLVQGDYFILIDDEKVYTYDINKYVDRYEQNAKCVIKHMLFLNMKLKSIKNNRKIRDKFCDIRISIQEKINKDEITKIIESHITTEKEEKKSFFSFLFKK